MLRLVNVRAHWHNAADASRVCLGRSSAGRVHDGILSGTQEISRATQTVQHARAHDAGAVGVGIDVDFDGCVHTNHAQTADDLGGVGDLLRSEEEL